MIWHAVNKKRFSKRRITAASVLGCILKQICYALQLLHVPRIMVPQVMLTGRYLTLLLAEVNRTTQAYARASGIGSHRHKRPLTSQNFICNEKEKRYKRNMMFLLAGHSAGLLSKNFVKQRLHENFRIPATWLTKEIIFVCTVFLLFTL